MHVNCKEEQGGERERERERERENVFMLKFKIDIL